MISRILYGIAIIHLLAVILLFILYPCTPALIPKVCSTVRHGILAFLLGDILAGKLNARLSPRRIALYVTQMVLLSLAALLELKFHNP